MFVSDQIFGVSLPNFQPKIPRDVGRSSTIDPFKGYLKPGFYQYLTPYGCFHAKGVKFKSDFHSLALVDDKNQTIGSTWLSIEEMIKLRNGLEHRIRSHCRGLE